MITHKKTITTLALAALIATSLPAHAFFSLRDAVNSFKKSTLAQVVAGGCALGLGAYLVYKWRYEAPKNTSAGSNNNESNDPSNTKKAEPSSLNKSSSSSSSSSSSAFTLHSAIATPTPTVSPLAQIVASETQQKQATDLKSDAESGGPVKILSAGSVSSNSMPFAVGQFDGMKEGVRDGNKDFAYVDQQHNIFVVCNRRGRTKETAIQESMHYENRQTREQALQEIMKQCASARLSFQEQLDPADAAKAIGESLCEGIKQAKGNEESIRTVFDETHRKLLSKMWLGCATAAMVAQIIDNKLIVAGLGNSDALLFKKDGSVVQLSKDSTPDFCLSDQTYSTNKDLHVVTHHITEQDDFVVLMSQGAFFRRIDYDIAKRIADIKTKRKPLIQDLEVCSHPEIIDINKQIEQLDKELIFLKFKELGDSIGEQIKRGKPIHQVTQDTLATFYAERISVRRDSYFDTTIDDGSLIIVKLNK